MIKNILICVFVAVIIFIGVVAMQPSELNISRSIAINTTPDRVFPMINNLKSYNEWSPWAKLDPDAKILFDGASEGVGSKMTWEGNMKVGSGTITNVEARLNELIKFKIDFLRPINTTHTAEFTLTTESTGSTLVTWVTYGKKTFMCKAMGLIFGSDKMMGEQLDQGLGNLKTLVESVPVVSTQQQPEITPPQVETAVPQNNTDQA